MAGEFSKFTYNWQVWQKLILESVKLSDCSRFVIAEVRRASDLGFERPVAIPAIFVRDKPLSLSLSLPH